MIPVGRLGQIRFGVPKGLWKVPPSLLYTCLPVPQLFFAFFSTALALGSSAILKVLGQMTRLSSGVLCSKWFLPPKRLFGVFPKQFFTLVSQSPAVFWANGCCSRKGSVEGSANYSLHLSPKWLLLHKSSLEGSAKCVLHLSPSFLLSSCVNC